MMKIVDLSVELRTGMPVYPGNQRTVVAPFQAHDDPTRPPGGLLSTSTRLLLFSDHGGTHVDAPNHMNASPQAPSIEQIPLDTFYRPAVCLDLSHLPPRHLINRADLDQSCQRAGLTVERGMTVLLYTGHYERAYNTPGWFAEQPGLARSGAEWLAEKGVGNVGLDAPSLDNDVTPERPGHEALRDQLFLHMENLTNLDQVVGRRFQFIGFPLKIAGATGSPIRAVAILED